MENEEKKKRRKEKKRSRAQKLCFAEKIDKEWKVTVEEDARNAEILKQQLGIENSGASRYGKKNRMSKNKELETMIKEEGRKNVELRKQFGYGKRTVNSSGSDDDRYIMDKIVKREQTMQKVQEIKDEIDELYSSVNFQNEREVRNRIDGKRRKIAGLMKYHGELGNAIENKKKKMREAEKVAGKKKMKL